MVKKLLIAIILLSMLGCTFAHYGKKTGLFYSSIGQERHLEGSFQSQKGDKFSIQYSSKVDPEVQAYKEGLQDGLKQLILK